MEYPDRNEIVIVEITKVLDYGVFAELLEYNNAKGFVHISNVSNTWVKNIRNFVKLGQIRAAKVLNIDVQKNQVDLSFGSVSSQREKQKINDYRQFKRSEKLIEALAKQNKKDVDEVWEKVAEPLIEEFDSLHDAFKKIAMGADIEKIIPKIWIIPLKELVDKNIKISEKVLKGNVKVSSVSSNGLDEVKEVLKDLQKIKGCDIIYVGAGTYAVSFVASTFKLAEKALNDFVKRGEELSKKKGVNFSFKKTDE
jgi:translation initiation factor 2 subunit 1